MEHIGTSSNDNISIHAPRVGSDKRPTVMLFPQEISIHAPRVGSDPLHPRSFRRWQISIHAPRVGSDVVTGADTSWDVRFQSTLPVWGATPRWRFYRLPLQYFNPRSPCGERRSGGRQQRQRQQFQSTLPVWGATEVQQDRQSILQFQSTLPVWGATWRSTASEMVCKISIHAPRVGSDITN